MTTARIGLWVTGLAALLGLVGDTLLRETPWGINFGLWVLAVVISVLVISQRTGAHKQLSLWLLLPVSFAALLAWRDAPFLAAWNFLAAAASLTLLRLFLLRRYLGHTTVFAYVRNAVEVMLNAACGALVLTFGDVRWLERDGGRSNAAYRPIVIGLLLTVPLVLVFGALFMAADPVFEALVRSALDWDFETLASHLLVALFIAWLTAGYLRSIALRDKPLTASLPEPKSPSLGIVEIGIPLGTLIAIFAIFVTIQIQYLFGGEDLIHNTLGLSYSEYARRGFFELVTVTTLIAPVLLTSDWMLDKGSSKNRSSFAVLAIVLLIMVFVVMASALERMRLYVDAYGLTQDRFYATAFMLWIATLLGWLIATVLRNQRRRFALGAMVSGFLLLLSLNVINPDAMIARTNIGRPSATQPVDVHHLTTLSADAVPAMLARVATLEPGAQCQLIAGLRQRNWFLNGSNWRTWNVGRSRARRALLDADRITRHCDWSPTASADR
ncbi:MAG: DUF4173 domain-containing protein [Gemmatimonadota bacterium]|nr:MAG: DUF4173 domain-containing protein [Gemmatimonadota bacterium]